MSLQEIVNVQITRETVAVSRAGFGTLLIVTEHETFPDKIRFYSSIDEVASDGFLITDPAYVAANAAFSQGPRPLRVAIGQKDVAPATWTAELDLIQAASDDWYGLVIGSRLQADIVEVATWTESRRKLFCAASADAGVLDPGSAVDVASALQDGNYFRSLLIYHDDAATIFPDAALMGKQLATDPGSTTWKFKTLAGTPVTVLSTTESSAARDKNAMTYEAVAGVAITAEGKVAGGEYVDVMRFIDSLHADMTESVFARLASLPKIPYTDPGAAVIEAEVRAALARGIEAGGLAVDPAPIVTVPKVATVSQQDRADRHLPDVNFSATLASAIHSTAITGTVAV